MYNHSEITIQEPSEPTNNMYGSTSSPVLKFSSGPRFESKPASERNISSTDQPEVDQSIKALMLESMKPADVSTTDSVFSSTSYDSEDNVSVISEVSTCSSAVTLETVDEAEHTQMMASSGNSRRRTSFRSVAPPDKAKTPSLSDSGINCPSSSDTEDAEDGRKLSSSKKTTDPFTNGAGNVFTHTNGVSADTKAPEAEKSSAQPEASVVKKRRSSISRRISPAFSAIFSSGSLSGSGSSKAEPNRGEKEPKKTAQVKLRKLSLTMFHGKPSAAEKEMKKRRNTDPSLHVAQSAHNTSTKGETENIEPKTDHQEINNPEKNELELVEVFLKEEDLRIRDLIEHVLRAHLLSMPDYRRATCDRAGRSISKILKTLVSSMKEAAQEQCKVVCQVFIGAVKEEGILIATQALWNSRNDNFAAASFRNDAVFGLGVVISTPVH